MNISENIIDLGLLSELSYLKLENEYFKGKSYSKKNVEEFFNQKDEEGNPINTGIDDSESSMLAILDEYDIKHFKSFSSDLQLMLLEDKNNPGNYIVSFRGTEFSLFSADITSDFEMALGKETDQLKDALNYIKDLQANGLKSNDGSVIVPPLTKENTTVTGHSLGGALAQYIGYNTGFETYTFNGFGMAKNEATEGKPFSEVKDTSNIHNFYLGIDPVSTFASEIGGYTGGNIYEVIKKYVGYMPDSKLNILQKQLLNVPALGAAAIINSFVNEHYSDTFLGEMIHIIPSDGEGFWDNIDDHFMSGFNESLALYSSLEEIFGTSDILTINSYINELAMTNFEDINSSINVYNNINTNGMPKAIELIHNTLLGVYPRKNINYDDISTINDSLEQIISIVEDNGGIFYYSYFADSEALLSSAKEIKGLMYTLINNLPPIIVNNSNYELYEDLDISYISDEQLNDKALMYYHLITHKNTTIDDKIDFIDYSNNTTASTSRTNDININTKKVIFGSNDETKEEILVGTYNDDRIYGNAGNDKIIGNNGDNYLEGGSGDDYLEGGINNDTLIGGDGSDILVGDKGTNILDGGEGNDTVSYSTSLKAVNVNLSIVTAQVINEYTTDTLINIENIIGSNYDDEITGDEGTNIIEGLAGSDMLHGGNNSTNVMYGGYKEDPFGIYERFARGNNKDEYGNTIKYDDELWGGTTTNQELLASGNLTQNHLYGGSGDDKLVAGRNADNYLYGGSGDDELVSVGIGYKDDKGSSYLAGGIGNDEYTVLHNASIEDEDGLGSIFTNQGYISQSSKRTELYDIKIEQNGKGIAAFYKETQTAVTSASPFAGYGGYVGSTLGSFTTTTLQTNRNYIGVAKKSDDGKDLLISIGNTNIIIKNYNFATGELGLTITDKLLGDVPITEENPNVDGSDSSENLFGTDINNTFNSKKGNDTIKDTAGGNDIYKFSKGDGKDSIYDISGNDIIQFDDTVSKEDITFKESANKKDLILTYSSRSEVVDGTEVIIEDYITITDYFNDISKIENILLSDGTKVKPDFNNIVTGTQTSDNIISGHSNDEIILNYTLINIENIIGSNNYEREAS